MADMGEKRWSRGQKTAIDLRDRTLLVSAAAGSGKTAVLTQRIISRLTDESSPCDISRLLVVTFTKAAAAELKDRIAAALTAELAKNPSNARLAKQLVKSGNAKISTIHSFCYDVIKQNFSRLELPLGVRIADEAESILVNRQIMNGIIEDFYDKNNSYSEAGMDFSRLMSMFLTSDRDDDAADKLIALYKRVNSYPEGIGFFANCRDELLQAGSENFLETKSGNSIKRFMEKMLSHYISVYKSACELFANDEEYQKKYLPSFECDYESAMRLYFLLFDKESGYTEIRSALSLVTKMALKPIKKELKTDESEYFCEKRKAFHDEIKKLRENFFAYDSAALEKIMKATAEASGDLYLFLSAYDKRLSEEKKRRSIVDFTDLERLTYDLFVDKEGSITDAARAQAAAFDEIYIDEYQDVNGLQDGIFSAISSNNRIMVGDIKQSIYGFRGAEPTIFSAYRERYPEYKEGSCDRENTVFLSNNFRCDRIIIDFMNAVCSRIFPYAGKSINYQKADDLVFSKITEEGAPEYKAETVILETERDNDAQSEAEYVARRIKALHSEGYSYGKMAVLLRKKSAFSDFEQAFKAHGIPTKSTEAEDFFGSREILIVISMLNAIDNPTRDIYLAGILKSPIYCLTLDELVKIRSDYSEGSLYEAIKAYSEEVEMGVGRCSDFLYDLTRYRTLAGRLSVPELIRVIYSETHMTALAGAEYQNRAEYAQKAAKNLMRFYEMARAYAGSEYCSLCEFIQYINDSMESGGMPIASKEEAGGDFVRIMTVHQSKGLEFEVCFISMTGSDFNRSGMRENLIISHDVGFGMGLKTDNAHVRYDTPLRRAAALGVLENDVDEEMRVLYVALTRARARLIVTASVKDADGFIEKQRAAAEVCDRYTVGESRDFISWIMQALLSDNESGGYCDISVVKPSGEAECEAEADEAYEAKEEAKSEDMSIEQYKELFLSRFDKKYSHSAAAQIPSKLTVSKLYPNILEQEDDGDESVRTIMRTPKFIEGEERISGAERGIATHVFMQFCNFENVKRQGIKQEAARLVYEGFISAAAADRINTYTAARFFESEIFADMEKSSAVRREVRFNINLPASEFTQNEEHRAALSGEEVLVQGVIDCFFENPDQTLTLLDYKTDYFTKDELQNPQAVAEELKKRHTTQLAYYKTALEKLTGKRVSRALIYSFALSDTVEID